MNTRTKFDSTSFSGNDIYIYYNGVKTPSLTTALKERLLDPGVVVLSNEPIHWVRSNIVVDSDLYQHYLEMMEKSYKGSCNIIPSTDFFIPSTECDPKFLKNISWDFKKQKLTVTYPGPRTSVSLGISSMYLFRATLEMENNHPFTKKKSTLEYKRMEPYKKVPLSSSSSSLSSTSSSSSSSISSSSAYSESALTAPPVSVFYSHEDFTPYVFKILEAER